MSGIMTLAGLNVPDLDTIKTDLEDDFKTQFGQSFNVRPTAVAGILIGILATQYDELWQATRAVYNSQNPDAAEGDALDALCQLTGVQRLAAQSSSSSCACGGTPGTIIAAGSRIKNTATGTFWACTAAGTIGGASSVNITFFSEDLGEIVGLAGTLTTIDTATAGWSTVTNATDASLGRLTETDEELRLRRLTLLTAQGKGTLASIRADILATAGVTNCVVYENVTLTTDADGVPGKAFEAVVDGGTSALIWQAIWDSKPAGISSYGNTAGTAADELGASHTVAFTRPAQLTLYVSLTAATAAGFSGLTADIAKAITAYGAAELATGADVVRYKAMCAVLDMTGVADVTDIHIGLSASPVGTANIVVGSRQRAIADTSRVVVVLV